MSLPTALPAPCEPAVPTLYVDEWLLAVHKPSGLLVHRTALAPDARVHALQAARHQARSGLLYPVHRLDRGASGLLLFARTRGAQRALSEQFAAHRVDKTYLAVVRGWPAQEGEIDVPLERLIDAPGAPRAWGEPQAALTRYRCLAQVELAVRVDRYPTSRYALVELHPVTGRRHQLRRHLRKIDHPLIGDTTYGNGRHNRLFRHQYGVQRLLLACVGLEVTHPATGARLSLRAPPAADFLALLTALGLAGGLSAHGHGGPVMIAAGDP